MYPLYFTIEIEKAKINSINQVNKNNNLLDFFYDRYGQLDATLKEDSYELDTIDDVVKLSEILEEQLLEGIINIYVYDREDLSNSIGFKITPNKIEELYLDLSWKNR